MNTMTERSDTPSHAPSHPRRAPSAASAAWTIALRELTDHVTSARFLVIALLVIGLTPLAVYVGARDYATRLAEYNRLATEQQEMVAGSAGERVTGRDNTWTQENEMAVLRALRSPEPLSVLVRGLDGALPGYWDFSSTGVAEGPAASLPQRLGDVLGQLDVEFLVRVVLGLLAILLAFDAVAGEKELGTLRAVLSQPISRSAFLAGKLVGGAITLLVPLSAAVLVALLSARLFGVDLLTGDTITKVALFAVASAVYLVCFYALGLLVSSLVAGQKTSLVVLLVAWVVAVLAIPSLSTLVAQAAVPVPPAYVVETQKRALNEDVGREAELAMGTVYREITGLPEGTVGPRFYNDHKEAIDRGVAPILLGYLNERRRLLGELDRDVERRTATQNTVARTIMALSPAAVFAGAAADLAGTGDADRLAWLESVRGQQGRLDRVLFEDPPTVTMRSGPNAAFDATLREPPSAGDLPAFAAPRRDAGAAVGRALPALGLLLLYTALFVAGGFIAFARYDVR